MTQQSRQAPTDSHERPDAVAGAPSELEAGSGEELEEPTTLQVAGRWLFNASVAGAVISIVVHVVFLAIAARILLSRPAGDPRGSETDIEVAVVSESQLEEIQEETLLEDPIKVNELEMSDLVEPPSADMPALDEALSAADVGEVTPMGGAADNVGDGFETPTGAGSVASFFGVEARGSRFAYIVDRSGSMADRDRIEVLKTELVNSIDGLSANASFMVYFYSGETRALGNRTKWLTVNERNREMAAREIRGTTAYGGTNPVPAFVEAFNMRPKPDVVYFMTDGVFPEEVAGAVREINAQTGAITPIHTISFIDRSAEEILKRIARDSSGTYTHVPGPGG